MLLGQGCCLHVTLCMLHVERQCAPLKTMGQNSCKGHHAQISFHLIVHLTGWVSCASGCITTVSQFVVDTEQYVQRTVPSGRYFLRTKLFVGHGGGGGVGHQAMVLVSLPLAAPIGLSPLHILTLCGSERVVVVSTEPLDELSCLATPGSAVPEMGCCPCR